MAAFFRTSTVWWIEYHYQGRPRQLLRCFGPGVDAAAEMSRELAELHGGQAQLLQARLATPQEEQQYLRGEGPVNAYCPSGRAPRSAGRS